MASAARPLAVSRLSYRWVAPVILFVAGASFIAVSVLSGETDVSLLLIFPVFSGSGGLFLLGVAFIVFSFIAGFVFLMMGQLELAEMSQYPQKSGPAQEVATEKARYGGVVLVGPIPIAFGSDKTIAMAMVVIGIVLAVAAMALVLILLS